LHATIKAVVYALREQGILVDEELVRQVPIEFARETTRGRGIRNPWRISNGLKG
jgi:hypothetical protein